MPPGVRLAALCAALLVCLALVPAAGAQEPPPQLVAQLAQAQPEQPELSEDPPTELEGGEDEEEQAEPEPTAEPTAAPEDDEEQATPRERRLAETGSEAGTLALIGFALLGWGVALRLRLRDAA